MVRLKFACKASDVFRNVSCSFKYCLHVPSRCTPSCKLLEMGKLCGIGHQHAWQWLGKWLYVWIHLKNDEMRYIWHHIHEFSRNGRDDDLGQGHESVVWPQGTSACFSSLWYIWHSYKIVQHCHNYLSLALKLLLSGNQLRKLKHLSTWICHCVINKYVIVYSRNMSLCNQ